MLALGTMLCTELVASLVISRSGNTLIFVGRLGIDKLIALLVVHCVYSLAPQFWWLKQMEVACVWSTESNVAIGVCFCLAAYHGQALR